MSTILHLLAVGLFQVLVTISMYLIDKRTSFGRLNHTLKQIIFGIVFGGLAVLSTEFGVDIGGAVINVRDAAPLCAGLIFGAPAGIISGVIGGVERWFAVLWGAGEYTRLACTIATVFAGLLGAVVRKFMLNDKKPSWLYGLAVGLVAEVLHMLMVFLTNMSDVHTAFTVVAQCALPMILVNGISVMLSVLAVTKLGKEKVFATKSTKKISQTFQRWLLICVLIAFALTCTFTFILQNRLSLSDSEKLMRLNIQDVYSDIQDASDKALLNITNDIADSISRMENVDSDDLSLLKEEFNVSEINLVGTDGVIFATTQHLFMHYNMGDGDQSAAFLPLLSGEKEIVQSYQQTSFDSSIYRKYAGVSLPEGGFVQVGYDSAQFKSDIDSHVTGATRNRHIGETGAMIITDENRLIVSDRNNYEGKHLSETGLYLNTEDIPKNTIFTADVYGQPSYCMYATSEGYYIIAALPKTEVLFSRDVSVYITVFIEILVFAVLFGLIYFLVKRVVVDNLQKVNSALSRITDGNLNVTVDVRSNEEFASLSDDINQTVDTLKQYIDEAAARIDKELEFARDIQHSALPSVFPPYPNRKDFDIYADMITAKEVGGDFYDFYFINENTLTFLIADVSGKGIPAAMFMMTSKTLLKSLAETGRSVSDVLTEANTKLCENNDAGMFVTVWMGILDLNTGIIKFANAGHNPPLIKKNNGQFEYLKVRPGLVLAGMDGIKYRENEVKLEPGDEIFLYTDGVTEATDSNNTLYGEERLVKTLNSFVNEDLSDLLKHVKLSIDEFVGEAVQFDDITMLSIRINHIENGDHIALAPTNSSIKSASEFVEKWTERETIPQKYAGKLMVALDEIYSNIVYYSKATKAEITLGKNDESVTLTFKDNGTAYNPLNEKAPDITKPADERDIGGLGLLMVRKLMSDIKYEYIDGFNILTLTLNI